MSGWQRWLAKEAFIRMYRPVGASNKSQLADFGGVALALAGQTCDSEPSIKTLTDPVQHIAQELLVQGKEILPPFVIASIHDCIDPYRARHEYTAL